MAQAIKQTEMPSNFDFKEAEERLYQWWEENGWFKPEAAGDDAETFVIPMPPPQRDRFTAFRSRHVHS
ncbi:MAG: hypothetical protein Q9P01_06200 [Anaerolineae bacterium]|nr:hypothetical protein [Anaerolineae bacterium]